MDTTTPIAHFDWLYAMEGEKSKFFPKWAPNVGHTYYRPVTRPVPGVKLCGYQFQGFDVTCVLEAGHVGKDHQANISQLKEKPCSR